MKNYRLRKDGYYEWRKVINNHRYSIKNKNFKILQKKVSDFKNSLTIQVKQKITYDNKTFYNLAINWFELFKKGKIASDSNYKGYIYNDFNKTLFQRNINLLTIENLQDFLNKIDKHRKAKYCYNIIRNVYKYALQKEIIKKDISQFLQAPANKTKKGSAFTLKEQTLIINNLHNTPIKYEILFYLLTGCRRTEAYNIKESDINFERNMIYIDGTKTRSAKRYIPISEEFKNILLNNKLFTKNIDYYTKEFQKYLNTLNISNKKLHDLRHTYSTNLYYLGVPDKQRQYYMGHSSIVMTNDIYTTLDPTITKEDIIKLYNNLYPKFT